MNKPLVVLADLDANYLMPIEDKFTAEHYDQFDLEIITSEEYFDYFFSTPRKIDILVISSSLYSQNLSRHNITDLFILSEDPVETQSKENITILYKYSSTKEIFNQIIYKNKIMLSVQRSHRDTQVIVVTSSIGGSGKTTVSLALSERLSRNHKRVLYISTDLMQSFSYYLQNKTSLPNDVVRVFAESGEKLFAGISPYLRNEGFTYLPPFGRNILSLGLSKKIYLRLILAAKASKQFDYIVVDTDINFDEDMAEMIRYADKVIVNILQDAFATHKTDYMVRNIDCRDTDKFVFVCNRYRSDVANEYVASPVGGQFIIAEYIDELSAEKVKSLSEFAGLAGIMNLAYVFS